MILALALVASATDVAAAEQAMHQQWSRTLEVMESADADARANDPTSRIDLAGTMRAEQSTWLSFVEAKCRFEAEWHGPVDGRENVTAECMVDAFKQRTKRLAALQQEYDDERQ